jgi:hypothetical protein
MSDEEQHLEILSALRRSFLRRCICVGDEPCHAFIRQYVGTIVSESQATTHRSFPLFIIVRSHLKSR